MVHMNRAFPRLLLAILTFCFCGPSLCATEPERLVQRIKELSELAEKGDGPSQLKLALAYDEAGESEMAVPWFHKAALKGYAQAALGLGIKCFVGDGVSIDKTEAVKWFRIAAKLGESIAQYNLAGCLMNGDGVGKNCSEAVRWCRVAAENHYPDAEYMMGVLYGRGDGVPQDYVKSFEWVSMAAAHGHPQAKKSLETLKGMMTPEQIARAKELADKLQLKVSTGSASP
jgi:TPR repeat protein